MNLSEAYKKFDIYWQMIVTLVVLAGFGVHKYGFADTLSQLAIAVAVAAVSDSLINFSLHKQRVFPKSAIISGLFVGMLLNVGIVWYVPVIAALVSVLTKNFVRYKQINIFNPAAIGVLIALILFPNSSSWWGGEQLIAVIALGLPILYRIKRMQMVAIFLASYSVISIVYDYSLLNISSVQNLILNPTLLFFSFFMLTEHKTNPFNSRGRMIYAPVAAILSLVSLIFLPQYNFVLGLIAANFISVLLNQITMKTSSPTTLTS